MDPELTGRDPVLDCVLRGKGHIYYALTLAFFVTVAVAAGAPRWLCVVSGGMLCGVFADCWAHEVLH